MKNETFSVLGPCRSVHFLSFCNFNFQLAQIAPQFLLIKVPRNLSKVNLALNLRWLQTNLFKVRVSKYNIKAMESHVNKWMIPSRRCRLGTVPQDLPSRCCSPAPRGTRGRRRRWASWPRRWGWWPSGATSGGGAAPGRRRCSAGGRSELRQPKIIYNICF